MAASIFLAFPLCSGFDKKRVNLDLLFAKKYSDEEIAAIRQEIDISKGIVPIDPNESSAKLIVDGAQSSSLNPLTRSQTIVPSTISSTLSTSIKADKRDVKRKQTLLNKFDKGALAALRSSSKKLK